MKYLFVLLLVVLMVGCVEDTRPLCDKVDGLQIADESLVPSDYTGVVKRCEDGKVQRLLNYKDGKQDGLTKSWNQEWTVGVGIELQRWQARWFIRNRGTRMDSWSGN